MAIGAIRAGGPVTGGSTTSVALVEVDEAVLEPRVLTKTTTPTATSATTTAAAMIPMRRDLVTGATEFLLRRFGPSARPVGGHIARVRCQQAHIRARPRIASPCTRSRLESVQS
jgi:hypothetical protein